jgi:hypothetical protein
MDNLKNLVLGPVVGAAALLTTSPKLGLAIREDVFNQ